MYGGKEECQSVIYWDIGDPQIACLLETVVFPANLEVPEKGPFFMVLGGQWHTEPDMEEGIQGPRPL